MADAFKIDTGIPLPPRATAPDRYPFPEMDVGDSFFVPEEVLKRASVQAASLRAGKRYGCKFSTRAVEGGCRVWRIQ